jgi:hypothetical protein
MRKWIGAGVVVVVVLLLMGCGIYGIYSGMIRLGVQGGACAQDTEIAQADRDAIAHAAAALTDAIIAGDSSRAYGQLSQGLHASVSAAQFTQFVTSTNKNLGPFHDPKPVHTYLLNDFGTGSQGRSVCGPLGGDEWVSVAMHPGVRQAYALVDAQTRNNGWTFSFWFLPENGGWRATDVHVSISSMIGKSARDLLVLARQERDAGRAFNATMLYAGSQYLVGRGPAIQLGLAQTLSEEQSKFMAPPELQSPPFTWALGGKPYTVSGVTILGIDGQLVLSFDLPETSWPGNDAIEAQNHAFLDGFRAAHPEVPRVFGALIARAHKPDGSGGFASVYDYKTGYSH